MSKTLDINLQIPEVFQPMFNRDKIKYPYVSLPGGRASTKSWTVAQYSIFEAIQSEGDASESIPADSGLLHLNRIVFPQSPGSNLKLRNTPNRRNLKRGDGR